MTGERVVGTKPYVVLKEVKVKGPQYWEALTKRQHTETLHQSSDMRDARQPK